jgi:hypothetical protein
MGFNGFVARTESNSATAADETLDVLNMTQIPYGTYDVQLEGAGKKEIVKIAIKGDRVRFVKSTSPRFEGLSGSFELLGNGVFVAHFPTEAKMPRNYGSFGPDGTARVKESPDRGAKQIAKLSSEP